MAILVSSGGLVLLTIGSLLMISGAVHTSETAQSIDQNAKLNQDSNPTTETISESMRERLANNTASRGRSARFFSQDGNQRSQSEAQQQQYQERSMSMESYAAALAAANSAVDHHSNGSADLVQSTIPANDAVSFGEQPASLPAASTGRQFEATEYSPVHAASGSYYATGAAAAASTSSSASNYLPNHPSSGGAHHQHHSTHSSPSYANHQQHYQPSPSTYNSHHYGAATKKIATALPSPLNYPSYDYWSSPSYFADRSGPYPPPMPSYWSSPHFSSPTGFGSGLISSASSALSHWTGGFGVAEIICGIIALSVGAVILGAPFFLIYLALMGNFSGSGTLSLANPTQSGMTTGGPGGSGTATINGRRKRLAIFEQATGRLGGLDQPHLQLSALADTVISQLSPFVDFQQVTDTFRQLVNSIEKYSKLNSKKPTGPKSATTRKDRTSSLANKKRLD